MAAVNRFITNAIILNIVKRRPFYVVVIRGQWVGSLYVCQDIENYFLLISFADFPCAVLGRYRASQKELIDQRY